MRRPRPLATFLGTPHTVVAQPELRKPLGVFPDREFFGLSSIPRFVRGLLCLPTALRVIALSLLRQPSGPVCSLPFQVLLRAFVYDQRHRVSLDDLSRDSSDVLLHARFGAPEKQVRAVSKLHEAVVHQCVSVDLTYPKLRLVVQQGSPRKRYQSVNYVGCAKEAPPLRLGAPGNRLAAEHSATIEQRFLSGENRRNAQPPQLVASCRRSKVLPMSSYRRDLDQQLAEIAAGRRKSVDAGLQMQVSIEERAARDKADQAARDTAQASRESAMAARDTAQASRDAAKAAAESAEHQRKQAALAREALAVQERLADELVRGQEQHHEEMQALEKKRIGLLQAEQRRQERRDKEEARERRRLAEEQAEREERRILNDQLARSPCFAAARTQAQLQLWELAERDLAELRDIVVQVVPLAQKFDAALAEVLPGFEAQARAELATLQAEVAAKQQLLVESESTLAQASAHLQALKDLSWWNRQLPVTAANTALAEAAQARAEQSAEEARSELAAAERARDAVSFEGLLASRVKAFALAQGVLDRIRELGSQRGAWYTEHPRSRHALEGLVEMPELYQFIKEVEVNFAACCALDAAYQRGEDVRYPGLGTLLKPAELPEAVLRIRAFEERHRKLKLTGFGTATHWRWLVMAHYIGRFDLSREPTASEERQCDQAIEESIRADTPDEFTPFREEPQAA